MTLSSLVAAGLALGLVATTAPAASATPWPGHADRSIVRHVVRAGETATGLAVRYHAWTDELVALNGLGSSAGLRTGRVIRIPVVVSAYRRAHHLRAHHVRAHHVRAHHVRAHHVRAHQPRRHHARPPVIMHSITPRTRGWLHADLTRTQVRDLVSAVARHYGVPRALALAIAWQESGWQQRRVSSAGALGVMQVMPDTGRWMRWYAGRPLRLRDTHDNVRAGILTLRVLRSWTRYDNTAIAAYYQGLGAVRKHGYYRDTRQYVLSVRAHERRLLRTGSPV